LPQRPLAGPAIARHDAAIVDRGIARAMHARLAITVFCLMLPAMPASAAPEPLKGQRFIDVMSGNTLSGETVEGTPFNMYFLDGGEVTYDDASNARDHGRWWMDPDGDVCLRWEGYDRQRDRCFAVSVEGDHLFWRDKGASGEGVLRGGVGDTFLQPRP
jgi:hypothetical protein